MSTSTVVDVCYLASPLHLLHPRNPPRIVRLLHDDERMHADPTFCYLPIARHWNSNEPRILAARHGWWAFRHNCTASSNLPARTNEYND